MRETERARPRIVIAAGGTGGHVFPGLAVADALCALADVEPVFAGTPRGLEAEVIPARGYRLELFDVLPLKGGGFPRAAKGALVAARETVRALGRVRALAPRAVLSVGGYASGPVTLAGAATGAKVALLEPNAVLGLANTLLSPLAARAYLAFDETAVRFRGRARGVRVFGVPLRAGFTPSPYAPGPRVNVLVLGGSQGAAPLNERLPLTVAALLKMHPALAARLDVVHQAGRGRDYAVREAYAREGVTQASVVPFIVDVAAALASADLVIARSGAGSVAEIAAIGRASILIPFPQAADDHQTRNAEALSKPGAALTVPQREATPDRLATELAKLLTNDAARQTMATLARTHGHPEAAYEIANDLLTLTGIPLWGGSRGGTPRDPAAHKAQALPPAGAVPPAQAAPQAVA